MRGLWLNQNDSAAAIGHNIVTFGKYKPTLRQRKIKYGKNGRTEYFIPLSMMTAKMKRAHEADAIDYDDEAQAVEEVLGDVTEGIDALSNNSEELNAARLENLKARTALINEKLENRKQELFNEWSERFFSVFTESFAKFKNALIELHLTEDQIINLTEKLEAAMKSMEDKLIEINNDFINEEDKDNEENREV